MIRSGSDVDPILLTLLYAILLVCPHLHATASKYSFNVPKLVLVFLFFIAYNRKNEYYMIKAGDAVHHLCM